MAEDPVRFILQLVPRYTCMAKGCNLWATQCHFAGNEGALLCNWHADKLQYEGKLQLSRTWFV